MLFNSLDFALFLPIVFVLYWFVTNKNLKLQNLLIVVSSYIFYGWWDWRYLSLIFISSVIDYAVGLLLSKEENPTKRKLFLWVSIISNLTILGFFKYFNFFLESFTSAFSFFGFEIPVNSLNIVLPVGISFYTFQTMSYSIDVYRKKLTATTSFINFSAFVSFFPQLVAGPIERATHLLPQFDNNRSFDYDRSIDGLRQILWGLFKKIVIADNCAEYANLIFNNSSDYSGSTLVLGAVFFAFQIYGDFSGYSDIAIGTSRLFGFDLKKNFAFPYFSRDIAEFWRRWHISLSSWFRDYLYIPLGGSRGSKFDILRNTFIIFAVSGFWHGANWTFIVWGILNAIYFIPLLLTGLNRNHLEIVAKGKYLPNLKELLLILSNFALTLIAWIFFRSDNISNALSYINEIFSISLFTFPEVFPIIRIFLIVFFIVIEWVGRENNYAIEKFGLGWNRYYRWTFYYLLMTMIFLLGGKQAQFIYFQF